MRSHERYQHMQRDSGKYDSKGILKLSSADNADRIQSGVSRSTLRRHSQYCSCNVSID